MLRAARGLLGRIGTGIAYAIPRCRTPPVGSITGLGPRSVPRLCGRRRLDLQLAMTGATGPRAVSFGLGCGFCFWGENLAAAMVGATESDWASLLVLMGCLGASKCLDLSGSLRPGRAHSLRAWAQNVPVRRRHSRTGVNGAGLSSGGREKPCQSLPRTRQERPRRLFERRQAHSRTVRSSAMKSALQPGL